MQDIRESGRQAVATTTLVFAGVLCLLASVLLPALMDGPSCWTAADRREASALNERFGRLYHAYRIEQVRRERLGGPPLVGYPPALVRIEEQLAVAEAKRLHAVQTPQRWARRLRWIATTLLAVGVVVFAFSRDRQAELAAASETA
ncbi:MAG: hypothetical protein AAGJ46_00700 [Planctomycetota bacterium]